MFNNKFDMETIEIKIAHYSAYFYRIFDLLLISENLWNGNGERPYSFKFIPIAMTDQISQDQLMAENKLENIINENKKLNKDLVENENEQTSTNSINETRSHEIKNTTNND